MTVQAQTLILAGAFAAFAFIPGSAPLLAQEAAGSAEAQLTEAAKGAAAAGSAEATTTAESAGSAETAKATEASATTDAATATEAPGTTEGAEVAGTKDGSTVDSLRSTIQNKFEDTISGIKSGEISTAKQAAVFDDVLRRTLIRISDCWDLCKQEMNLSDECARQEAIQTAKDIFQKGKDAAMEQGREIILNKLPPMLGGTSGTDKTAEKPGEASLTDPSAAKPGEASQAAEQTAGKPEDAAAQAADQSAGKPEDAAAQAADQTAAAAGN